LLYRPGIFWISLHQRGDAFRLVFRGLPREEFAHEVPVDMLVHANTISDVQCRSNSTGAVVPSAPCMSPRLPDNSVYSHPDSDDNLHAICKTRPYYSSLLTTNCPRP